MSGSPEPIPLALLTGFLGAGKTTLLNRLLRDPALEGTLVIVNEFGEIGLDHALIEAADEGVVLLQAGCLCCTIRGELARTLEDLLRRRDNGRIAPFQRVVLETTGLADPAPILASVLQHPYLRLRFSLDIVVTVVDAANGLATLDRHGEARRQAAVADRIVLTKTDLAGGDREALRTRLAALNPLAPVLDGAAPIDAGALLGGASWTPAGKSPDVSSWLDEAARDHDHAHAHDPNRHGESIRAFSFESGEPVTEASLAAFFDLLRENRGPALLRAKGLVLMREEPQRPLVVHAAQGVVHAAARLPHWPEGSPRTRLVFVTDGIAPARVEGLWNALTASTA